MEKSIFADAEGADDVVDAPAPPDLRVGMPSETTTIEILRDLFRTLDLFP